MQQLCKGILISIEGIDGSGKSTLAKNLAAALASAGFDCVQTREPGATPLGMQLRTLVQEKKVPLCAQSEFLLFAADRAQHFQQIIIPQLAQRTLILSDRMADSSLVYQGYGRGLSRDMIAAINAWAMSGITPDLTIYVRVSAQLALERIMQRKLKLSSFEKENLEFTQRLVTGFDEIFKTRENCIEIDGSHTEDAISTLAQEKVITWIHTNKLIS